MLEKELENAKRVARDAGRILTRIYETDFGVAYKGASDPVTEADREANDYIVEQLRALHPEDGIVAEESPDRGDATGCGRVWYVDPLDGTKEFIAKNGEFSVMLGLAVDGRAVLGVVYQPVHDKLYAGVVGEGATLERAGDVHALSVSEVAEPAELRLVVSRSHRSDSTGDLVQRLGIRHETASGSVGLKVGLIAERSADLYVHISDRSSAWDACGPEAILRAAGGRFTDLAGDAYVYGAGPDLRNSRGILACNAAAFPSVLPVARAVAVRAGLLPG
jgi:3'(2'), 5'-bisphosphate nucleotidase